MCGRYTQTRPASDLASELDVLLELEEEQRAALRPRYNVAPTQPVPIVLQRRERALRVVRWGFVPAFAKALDDGPLLVNARAETLAEKPTFRDALLTQRCLVLGDGFYEWQRGPGHKTPYYLRMRGAGAFAGLWSLWRAPDGHAVPSCAIITVPANDLVAPIHDRMPAILRPSEYEAWLDYGTRDPSRLEAMLRPLPNDALEAWPVSPRVNGVQSDDPSLIAPLI